MKNYAIFCNPLPYDFAIIDTPPSLCWLTESALIAAQHTLVCATPEFYSVKGLERLCQFMDNIGQRHPLNILGVVLSFWNSRGKSNQAFLEVIEHTFPQKTLQIKSAAIFPFPKPPFMANLYLKRIPAAVQLRII